MIFTRQLCDPLAVILAGRLPRAAESHHGVGGALEISWPQLLLAVLTPPFAHADFSASPHSSTGFPTNTLLPLVTCDPPHRS